MRFAVIENGVVANVIEAPEDWASPTCIASLTAAKGDRYEDGVFIPVEQPAAAPVIPDRVPMASARLALLYAGLLDDVEAALAALGDSVEARAARIQWEYETSVVRSSQLVQSLVPALGLTDQQLDELFLNASRI